MVAVHERYFFLHWRMANLMQRSSEFPFQPIPMSFASIDEYRASFVNPCKEELAADLKRSMETLLSRPHEANIALTELHSRQIQQGSHEGSSSPHHYAIYSALVDRSHLHEDMDRRHLRSDDIVLLSLKVCVGWESIRDDFHCLAVISNVREFDDAFKVELTLPISSYYDGFLDNAKCPVRLHLLGSCSTTLRILKSLERVKWPSFVPSIMDPQRNLPQPYDISSVDLQVASRDFPDLNQSQKEAVVLATSLMKSVMLIHGPPGTGSIIIYYGTCLDLIYIYIYIIYKHTYYLVHIR
jgi:hypothetical protein